MTFDKITAKCVDAPPKAFTQDRMLPLATLLFWGS